MPAKRSPKKSRTATVQPFVPDVTPIDAEAIAVAPASIPSLPASSTPPTKAGPPARGGAARYPAGRSQQAPQARRYAFRRS
ncbi:hypothetical protein ACIBXA_09950 [Micromonospora echinaurantiaca]|uniref:hypothetical protein n=1 Tax=Micromonospora echinaurantiaca TaxID=47857 RepID=UPI0037889246